MSLNPFRMEYNTKNLTKKGETNERKKEELKKQWEIELNKSTPMDDPPLHNQPEVKTAEDEEYLAPHLQDRRKPGDPNPKGTPLKFPKQGLQTNNPMIQGLAPDQVIGRTFLMLEGEDGTRVRAKIIRLIEEHKQGMKDHPSYAKVKCIVDDKFEEIVAYNDICNYIEADQTWEGIWNYKRILSHQGPLKTYDPGYKGSRYNVLLEWETGEKTWEPLTRANGSGITDQDKVTVALYAMLR